MSHRHTVCWTMIELKSVDESEQSSVNILWQFWIESDNRSSHKFWILKSIYQNCTTSTLYHYIPVHYCCYVHIIALPLLEVILFVLFVNNPSIQIRFLGKRKRKRKKGKVFSTLCHIPRQLLKHIMSKYAHEPNLLHQIHGVHRFTWRYNTYISFIYRRHKK